MEAYSYEESKSSSNNQGQDDALEQRRNAEMQAINDKYSQQVAQLEARGINPLTKKLIEKIRKEWDEAIKRKEEQLATESLDDIQVHIQDSYVK